MNTNLDIDELTFDELVAFLSKRFLVVVTKQEAYSRLTKIKQGHSNGRDFGNRIDEISESVMGILTELQNNESRDQFLKSIFINGLNLEIKKLVGLDEFATNNNCVQTALKAEKLITNRNSILVLGMIGNK